MTVLDDYGFSAYAEGRSVGAWFTDVAEEGLVVARVCEVQRDRYLIVGAARPVGGLDSPCLDDDWRPARIKTGEFRDAAPADLPAVGDYVLARPVPDGDDQIWRVLPRRTKFSRLNPSPGMGEQVVAANFDLVLIVTSLNRDFNPRRLERYLAAARQSGARAAIALTKSDLCADPAPFVREASALDPDAIVLVLSAPNGVGLDALRELLAPGLTAVLLGSSGAGKSSLVNALSGDDRMRVNSVREGDDRGRHTTTHRELIRLDTGAILIDTPGMRMMGLWDAEEAVSGTFPEIEALLGQCRFADCGHGSEPGCAIRQALADGSLDPKRWAQYLKLGKEAEYAADPEAYARRKGEWHKDIAKFSRSLQKNRSGRDEW